MCLHFLKAALPSDGLRPTSTGTVKTGLLISEVSQPVSVACKYMVISPPRQHVHIYNICCM